jgi:hypothetical protein
LDQHSNARSDKKAARLPGKTPLDLNSFLLIEFAQSSSKLNMKKLVVLLLVIAGMAFLLEPTARAGVRFVFGLPIPVPVFYGPGYYGPGPYYYGGYYGGPYYGYGYGGYGPYWRHRYYNGFYGRGFNGRRFNGHRGHWHH